MGKLKFKITGEVEIPNEDATNLQYAFQNLDFDFFRYLAENNAKIGLELL